CRPLNGRMTRNDSTDLAWNGTELFVVFVTNAESRLAIIERDPPINRDPFAIYIADANRYTVLTFTEIGEVTINQVPNIPAIPQLVPTAQVDIHLYNPAVTPFTSSGQRRAPAGSGGVLIGGAILPAKNNPTRHVAVDVTGAWPADPMVPWVPLDASPLGVYPGGDLYAGITSAGPMAEMFGGNLGPSASALAANSTGDLWIVRNLVRELSLIIPDDPNAPLDTILTIGAMSLTDVQAITYANGVIYAYDNATHELWEVDATFGSAQWPWGVITDSIETTFEYDITGMATDANGTIYGVGTIVATGTVPAPSTDTYMFIIDPWTGLATRTNTANPDTGLSPGPDGPVLDITFDTITSTLYGTDGTNLFTVDPVNG
ncbi:hypothetical protein LCGC14_2954180, partial [marine sediment metagenome]